MLTLPEISHATYGAWRLALFDAGGMRYFDRSLEGFWRSFRLAIWLAPIWLLTEIIGFSEIKVAGGWSSVGAEGWFRIASVEIIAYVIGWTAFPLAAYYVTRLINREDRYLGLIVADNWAGVIEAPLSLAALLFIYIGNVPIGWTQFLILFSVRLAVLYYECFIARAALNISRLGAAGIALGGFIIGEVISFTANEMMQFNVAP